MNNRLRFARTPMTKAGRPYVIQYSLFALNILVIHQPDIAFSRIAMP
ncbi:hypothetical protein [Xenorhabdus siamensis]